MITSQSEEDRRLFHESAGRIRVSMFMFHSQETTRFRSLLQRQVDSRLTGVGTLRLNRSDAIQRQLVRLTFKVVMTQD